MIKESVMVAAMALGIASSEAHPNADSLLGEWVRIVSKAGTATDAKCTFYADGTAVFQSRNGSPEIWKYSRLPIGNWAARGTDFTLCSPPPKEAITFERLTGSWLQTTDKTLYLVPDHGVLFSPRAQAWCRPGEEERVRKLLEL